MPKRRKRPAIAVSAKQTSALLAEFEANAPASIQCGAGETPEIDLEQEVPRFKGVAYSGGPLYWQGAPGPVILDLAGLDIPSQIVASGREHDRDAIVGNTTCIVNNGQRLTCEGVLSGDDKTVIETSRRAKSAGSQFPWQLTIDADYSKRADAEVLMPRHTARINGRTVHGPALIVRRSTLRMIDFTVKGADQHAKAVVQASAASGGFEMGFEDWVKSLGFDPAELTDVQKASLQTQYDALMADESAEGDDSGDTASVAASSQSQAPDFSEFVKGAKKAAREAAAAELQRQADIRAAIQAHAPNGLMFKQNGQEHDLAQFAIENDWSAKDAELQALRESRPKAPAGRADTLLASSDAIILALAVKGGMDIDRVFDRRLAIEASKPMPGWIFEDLNSDKRQKVMEAAHKLRGRNSIDLAIASLQASHQGGYGMDVTEAIQASFSSNSFGNVINTSAQITVLAKFDETTDSTDWVDDRTPAKNFLASTDVRLKTPSGSLSKLAPGGTAKPGKLEDTGEAYKADRYAESFVIDEQELINDRLGLIMEALGSYGEKAKRLKPDLVYALLMSNPTLSDAVALFHATHANLQTGVLNEANLAAAIAKLTLAKDNVKGIDAKVTDILVPPTQMWTAEGLCQSAGRIPVDTVGGPTENVIARRKINVIEEQRLENGVVDPDSGSTVNGSSVLTYLIDRTKAPIKAYYVEATGRSPQVRREALGVGQFGLAITTALDIGVAVVRYQTAVRIAGA